MPTSPRIWTLPEANAALPRLRGLMVQTRHLAAVAAETRAHLNDLRILHGDSVDDPACAGHEEWEMLKDRHRAEAAALDRDLAAYRQMGVVVKDIEAGLVDFYARHGSELVYLCWRDGEDTVAHWHTLDGGFAARRPVPEAPRP